MSKFKYFAKSDRTPSLEDVLRSRDQRVELIDRLISENEDLAILVFKLNIPGEEKTNNKVIEIFDEGVILIDQKFKDDEIIDRYKISPITGPEYFLLTNKDPLEVKRLMVDLEETAYFGRLYDIDITTKDGSISRNELKASPRKCFICDNEAKSCARSRKHSVDEMLEWIEDLIDSRNESDGKDKFN